MMSFEPSTGRPVFLLFLLVPHLLITSSCGAQKRDFTYVISEESEIGTFVGNILLDAGLEGASSKEDFDIQLYEDRTVGLFRADKHTGKLLVAKCIDREAICPQKNNVPFTMESSSAQNFEGLVQPEDTICRIELSAYIPPEHWVNIIVVVKDINDHAPKFQQVLPNSMMLGTSKSPYVLYISEGVNVGYQVPLIGATDEDYGINGVQTYSLTGKDFDKSTFSVNYQPPYELNLVVLTKLDHEKKTSYSGVLTACDGGKPTPLCTTQVLTIFVTDVNDNKPVFERALYEVKISENMTVGSVVTTVRAIDQDSGNFGKVRYQIGQIYDQSQSEFFEVDEWTGEVRVRMPLQAKFASRVRIPILAQDGGPIPNVGNTLLQIDVEDVNNHAPTLIITPMVTPNRGGLSSTVELPNRVQLWLEENQPVGTQIGIIRTGDDDVGINGEVTCSLVSNNSFFLLTNSNSARERKIYSLQSNIRFDHEQTQNPSLTADIECSDAGTPPLVTRQGIQVNILDVNEYHAYFPEDAVNYFAEISEDVPPGTFIVAVRAVDKDSTDIMHFTLSEEAQKYFRVDELTGEICTIEHLDREQTNEIRFAVHVHDENDEENSNDRIWNGDDATYTTANVTVRITDVNDNSPRLEGRRHFQVFENRPAYSDMIGQLMASDPDAGENGTVHFKLVSVMPVLNGVPNGTFEINPLTGKIYARVSLDHEIFAQYQLRVEISDTGRPVPRKGTETVIIDVLDENDNKPLWKPPQRLHNAMSIHAISSIVYLEKSTLDRSRMDYLAFVNVSEAPAPQNPLLRLSATDADSKPNANLSFHLILIHYYAEGFTFSEDGKLTVSKTPKQLNSSQSVFIDQHTWTLGLLPQAPVKHGLHELLLRLSDNGNPPLHSDAIMFLHLKDQTSSHLASLLGNLFRVGGSANSKSVLLVVMSILTICSLVLLLAICLLRRRSCRNEGGTIMTRNGNSHARSDFDDKDSGVGSGMPKVFVVPESNGGSNANGHAADVDGWARGQFYLTHHWLASPVHYSGLGTPPFKMSNSIHSPDVNNCSSINLMQSRDDQVEPTFCHVDARPEAERNNMSQLRFCKLANCYGHHKDSLTANSRIQAACLQVDLEAGSADSGHGASEEEANILEARKGYFGGLTKLSYGRRMTSTDTFKTSYRPNSLSTTVSTFGQRPYGLDGTSRHFSETYDTSTMPRFPESIILGGQSRELPLLSFEREHFGHNRPQTPDATLVGQPQICRTVALDPAPFNSERQTLPRSVEALTMDRRALR